MDVGYSSPAQAVLQLVDDILQSVQPQFAAELLGFPQESSQSDTGMLHSILGTLSTIRLASTQSELYCDSMHTLCNFVTHSAYGTDVQRLVEGGDELGRQILQAVIRVNEATFGLRRSSLGIKLVRCRADVYSVLSHCIEVISDRSDLHRDALIETLRSFFSEQSSEVLTDDIKMIEQRFGNRDESIEASLEMDRLCGAMARFVHLSVSRHWNLYKSLHPHGIGILGRLAGIAMQTVSSTIDVQQAEVVNASLVKIARCIFDICKTELHSSLEVIEEMYRKMYVVERAAALVHSLDSRMAEDLRTEVFGLLRSVVLVLTSLPEDSSFRRNAVGDFVLRMSPTTTKLAENLSLAAEPRGMQVVLFDLMTLFQSFLPPYQLAEKAEAFVDASRTSLPVLANLLKQTEVEEGDVALVNAQLVLLSKIVAPTVDGGGVNFAPVIPPGYAERILGPLRILDLSDLFGTMMKSWPPDSEASISRARKLQPTIRKGIKLLLNVLHRHRDSNEIQKFVCGLFEKHLAEFKTALQMGIVGGLINRQWVPSEGDREIAKLIKALVEYSMAKKRLDLFDQVKDLCAVVK